MRKHFWTEEQAARIKAKCRQAWQHSPMKNPELVQLTQFRRVLLNLDREMNAAEVHHVRRYMIGPVTRQNAGDRYAEVVMMCRFMSARGNRCRWRITELRTGTKMRRGNLEMQAASDEYFEEHGVKMNPAKSKRPKHTMLHLARVEDMA